MIKNIEIKILATFMLFLLVAFFVFILISCSGGAVIPDPVCEYGEVTCETLNYLCSTYPEIPPEICEYSNLACLALTVLCSSDPESPEYETAKTSLVYINQRLKAFVDKSRSDVR